MFKSKKILEYYDSIDNLPIDIWDKIHNDYDLTLLCKQKEKDYDIQKLELIWKGIYNEFLKEFGMSEQAKKIQSIRIEIGKLKCRWILENKRFIKTLIKVEQEKLKAIQEENQNIKVNLNQNLAKLSRFFKFKISKSITVTEYYSFLNEASNG